MQFSLVALFAAATVAAMPNMAVRNVPDTCDKQLSQCNSAPNADAAVCESRQSICLGNCEAGFDSCDNAAATNKDDCFSAFEKCAGHRRDGDPRPAQPPTRL